MLKPFRVKKCVTNSYKKCVKNALKQFVLKKVCVKKYDPLFSMFSKLSVSKFWDVLELTHEIIDKGPPGYYCPSFQIKIRFKISNFFDPIEEVFSDCLSIFEILLFLSVRKAWL